MYDVICPHCGHRNYNLYLDETKGWMECEKCGKLHQFLINKNSKQFKERKTA